MTEQRATPADVPDVRKSITVPAPPDEAFRIYVGFPVEWLPSAHTFLREPQAITIEAAADSPGDRALGHVLALARFMRMNR